MKRFICLVVLTMVTAFALTSWAETKTLARTPISPEQRFARSYTTGERLEARVGEVMTRSWSYKALPGFLATRGLPEIPAGSLLTCFYRTEEGDYVCSPTKVISGVKPVLTPVALKGGLYVVITPAGELKGSMGRMSNVYSDLPDGMKPKIFVPKESHLPESFDRELLYSGKQGSSIRISYRESMNGIARPSFNQEITYDLSESKEISFQNLQIEVYDASNTSIIFAVKKRD